MVSNTEIVLTKQTMRIMKKDHTIQTFPKLWSFYDFKLQILLIIE